jgi:hypothetical protein
VEVGFAPKTLIKNNLVKTLSGRGGYQAVQPYLIGTYSVGFQASNYWPPQQLFTTMIGTRMPKYPF